MERRETGREALNGWFGWKKWRRGKGACWAAALPTELNNQQPTNHSTAISQQHDDHNSIKQEVKEVEREMERQDWRDEPTTIGERRGEPVLDSPAPVDH